MLMLGLNETIDQLSMANSVCWCMLRRVDGHVIRRTLEFVVEWRKHAGWFEYGRCTLLIKVDC